jgi:hypothetical protein
VALGKLKLKGNDINVEKGRIVSQGNLEIVANGSLNVGTGKNIPFDDNFSIKYLEE